MGHFLILQPIFFRYFMHSFHPGALCQQTKLSGEEGKSEDVRIIKKRTFYTELILPIAFCFLDGLGEMTDLPRSALSHSQTFAFWDTPLHP